MAFSHDQHQKLNEIQSYAKPTYIPSREPTVHYQNSQIYSGPSNLLNLQSSNISQTPIQPNNSQINQINQLNPTSHQLMGSNNGNNSSIYNHSTMNQSAFGGFNFGMTSNLNNNNFNTNQNFTYNRPQIPINREPLNSMINKTSNFDQPIQNKCWSVGKIPTREPLINYGNQTQ